MKLKKTVPAMAAAVALGVSALVAPAATALPLNSSTVAPKVPSSSTSSTADDADPEDELDERTVPSGDKSDKCDLDFNASNTFPESDEHPRGSQVYFPFSLNGNKSQYVESAGFLDVQGWGGIRRVIAGTVFPLNDAQLIVTLPEDAKAKETTVSTESDFLWGNNTTFKQYGERFSNEITELGEPTYQGNTITIDLGDLEGQSAIDLRITPVGVGTVSAQLTGTWDPAAIEAYELTGENVSDEDKAVADEVRPDCKPAPSKPNLSSGSSTSSINLDPKIVDQLLSRLK